MIGARRRLVAIVLSGVVSAPLLPVPAAGRPARAPDCTALSAPGELAGLDAADLFHLAVACPGLLVRAKAKQKRLVVEEPGVKVKERSSELKAVVRRPAPSTAEPVPQRDPVQVALNEGYEIDQENTVEIESRPGYRSERREEETDIDGDGFDYRSTQTEERTEHNGRSSESHESEERFDSR